MIVNYEFVKETKTIMFFCYLDIPDHLNSTSNIFLQMMYYEQEGDKIIKIKTNVDECEANEHFFNVFKSKLKEKNVPDFFIEHASDELYYYVSLLKI